MSGKKASSAASGGASLRPRPGVAAGDKAGAKNAPRGPRPVKQVPGRRRAVVRSAVPQAEGPQNNNGPFSGVRIFYFFLFALLFLALYLSYLLVSPFLHTIILACIFTALSHPLYKRMLPVFRGNGWVASGVTLGILVIVVLIPLVFFIIQLVPQATRSIMTLAQWLSSTHLDQLVNEKIYPFLGWLNDELTWIDLDIQDMRESLLSFSRRAGQIMLSWGTGFFVDSLNMAANFGLMLLIMFFLFKDGEGMVNTVKHLTPLRAEQEDSIIHNLRRMAKSVLMGGFAVAALQGFVGGIGLAIVGIPPLFWGTVMAFAALVPVLGTALIWVPAVAYLALTGQTTSALFLLAWCGILVTSVDSFLRPVIIRGNNKTSLLFLFLSVLGGIKAFGVLGIVYGPLILSFVGVMLAMYSEEYSESLETYHNTAARKRKFGGPVCSPGGACRKKLPVPPARRSACAGAEKAAAKAAAGTASRPASSTPAGVVKTAATLAAAAGARPGASLPDAAGNTPAKAANKMAHGKVGEPADWRAAGAGAAAAPGAARTNFWPADAPIADACAQENQLAGPAPSPALADMRSGLNDGEQGDLAADADVILGVQPGSDPAVPNPLNPTLPNPGQASPNVTSPSQVTQNTSTPNLTASDLSGVNPAKSNSVKPNPAGDESLSRTTGKKSE